MSGARTKDRLPHRTRCPRTRNTKTRAASDLPEKKGKSSAGTGDLILSQRVITSILDAISDPIFVKDTSHRHLLVNTAFCRFLGRSREEILGKTDHDLYPADIAERLSSSDDAVCRTSIEAIIEERLSDLTGAPRVFLTKKAVCTDGNGGRFIVGIARDITAGKETEGLLERTTREWGETFDTLSEAITLHDSDFNVLRANKAAERVLNQPVDVLSSRKCYESFHGTAEAPPRCPSCSVFKTGKPTVTRMHEPHLGKHIEVKAMPRYGMDGRISGVVHIIKDITDEKKAEETQNRLQAQLIQAQKMESIGRLAGGIAHDFNNILTAIMGYTELALLSMPADHPLADHIRSINDAGERASGLTRQLLAFSRKQVLEMKVLDLNNTIRHMAGMLRRMIGEDVSLEIDLQADPSRVLADQNQIEQVLMNLAVNARDAMPSGGRLIVESWNTIFEPAAVRHHPEMDTGPFVVIAVSDTGTGMSSEVRERIFEPFFTTKDMGKGTGLGLATVYGIVKQHNGFIYVYSEPGAGTTFRIYLRPAAGTRQALKPREIPALSRGTETILITDDDPLIRRLACHILRPLGYRILEASSGQDALTVSASCPDPVHLLLTDVIMPGMHGKELAERLQKERPLMQVLFMSGYTDDMIANHGVLGDNMNFVQKPFTPTLLTKKLRQVLDRG